MGGDFDEADVLTYLQAYPELGKLFIETGTYKGETSRIASQIFQKVYTFEIVENLHNIAKDIGMVNGILPVVGIPLPFFSYGGSHLLVELIGVGLLLNISKNT